MDINSLISKFERDSTEYIELAGYPEDTSATLLRAAVSGAMNDGDLVNAYGLETFTPDEIRFIDANLFPS